MSATTKRVEDRAKVVEEDMVDRGVVETRGGEEEARRGLGVISEEQRPLLYWNSR